MSRKTHKSLIKVCLRPLMSGTHKIIDVPFVSRSDSVAHLTGACPVKITKWREAFHRGG